MSYDRLKLIIKAFFDIRNTKIIIHFKLFQIDYFCNFMDTDYKMTKLLITIHETPVRVILSITAF